MSASIRIKILGGTDIMYAYADCQRVSLALGGISVETTFNGVEMFYHGQRPEQWWNEFHERIGRDKKAQTLQQESATGGKSRKRRKAR
jgi:hypothetical protein